MKKAFKISKPIQIIIITLAHFVTNDHMKALPKINRKIKMGVAFS